MPEIMLDDVVADLKRREAALDEILKMHRETVRLCAGGIRLIHQNKREDVPRIVMEIRAQIDKMKMHGKEFEDYYLPVEQEYAEFVLLAALIDDKKVPTHQELGVSYMAYVNGIMDCVGELRRYMLDSIRREDMATAERMFTVMEQVHDSTLPLNFSRALLPSFKQKQDVSRRQVEAARAELTHAFVSMRKR